MEAEDTVIEVVSGKRSGNTKRLLDKALKHQAEISFKAGMEYGNSESYKCGVHNGEADGLAKGIREVVEWIEAHRSTVDPHILVHLHQWQAQLREWGIGE